MSRTKVEYTNLNTHKTPAHQLINHWSGLLCSCGCSSRKVAGLVASTVWSCNIRLLKVPCFFVFFSFFLQGDVQTQAAVRAIARQVCEQLIQSE